MTYLQWETRAIHKIDQTKSRIYRPLAVVLNALGVRPAWVTYAGVALMVAFVFVIRESPMAALVLMLVYALVLDCLDGSLARLRGTASDRGKFQDVLADNVSFFLFLAGIAYAGLVSGIVALVFACIMSIEMVLAIIKKSPHLASDWIFRPQAGPFQGTLRQLSYLVFLIYVLSGYNFLPHFAILFSAMLLPKALWDYWKVIQIPLKGDSSGHERQS